MDAFIVVCSGIFGLIVGSFLNVVILRMRTGKGIGGRSKCLSCGKTLAWYELVPVLSFLVQGGRCGSCRSPLSWQYPLVELVTGILFAGVAWRYLGLIVQGTPGRFAAALAFWFVFVSVGMVISVYDIRHRVIPLRGLAAFLVLCLAGGVFGGMSGGGFAFPLIPVLQGSAVFGHLWGLVLVPLPFLILWGVSRGALMGFGDVEIMAGMGLLLGTVAGFSAVTLSFWAGTLFVCLYAALRVALRRRVAIDRVIPFAPFLLLGIYLVGVLGLDLFAILLGVR